MSYSGKFKDKNNNLHPVTSVLYGTCDTAAATAAKVVACTDFDAFMTGVTIRVKFTNANTAASPTVNINSTGAKSVYRFGSTTPVDGDSWTAGEVVELLYDGTSFFMVGADDLSVKQNATDNSLETDAKTIVGAINEHEGDISSLKSGLTTLDNEVNGDATTYDFADVVTIEDAVPSNLADCSVKIEPVQDLHGYSQPWVGGANTNKVIYPYITTYPFVYGGVTVNDNKGRITITGNATSNFTTVLVGQSDNVFGNVSNAVPLLNADGKYTISGGTIVARLKVRQYRDGSLLDEHICTGTPIVIDVLSTDLFEVGISIYVNNTYNDTVSPQIEAGEIATAWSPYSNICPISGHTEVDVQRESNNLIPTGTSTANGFIDNAILKSDGTTSSSSDFEVSEYYRVNAETTYIYAIDGVVNNPAVCFYDVNKNYINGYSFSGNRKITVTTPSNAVYARASKHTSVSTTFTISNTYTIALGDTIYGGTVDFDSGVMTVTHGIISLKDLSWSYLSQNTRFIASISGAKIVDASKIADISCEICKTVSWGDYGQANYDCICLANISGTNYVGLKCFSCESVEDLLVVLDNYKMTYPIATPTTIQLTPQQIQLLKGQNTLTASTGQISVTVNGVSGSIGAVQEQVNDHEERIETVESELAVESVSLTAGENVVIDVNNSFRIGNLVVIDTKLHYTGEDSNPIVFSIDDNKTYTASNGHIIGLGGEWSISTIGYAYFNAQLKKLSIPNIGSNYAIISFVTYTT